MLASAAPALREQKCHSGTPTAQEDAVISASWARSQRLASTIPRAAPTTSRSSARARVPARAYACVRRTRN